jgi:hypothetical protein
MRATLMICASVFALPPLAQAPTKLPPLYQPPAVVQRVEAPIVLQRHSAVVNGYRSTYAPPAGRQRYYYCLPSRSS